MCFVFRRILLIVAFSFSFCVEENLLVSLEDGQIHGQYKQSYNGRKYIAFEGIPYAKPPINDLRFEDPQPVQAWNGILEAKNVYICLQISMLPGIFEGTAGQEDCLYLNVYVPREKISPNENLDVIFHIHGGAFMVGSPGMMSQPQKIMDRDVVYVSINYRLGPFGFYSTGDGRGNYGLKDQTAALRWVQKNIDKFGGNKNSVTITGMSAGGASTHLHYFSKLSKGLFHKGYAQSGVALNPWVVRKYPDKQGKILANRVGCFDNDTNNVRNCLKQRPAIQIANAIKSLYQAPALPLVLFGPTIEKDSPTAFLTKMPHEHLMRHEVTDVPLMMSMTEDEGTIPAAMLYNEIHTMNSNWSKWASLMLEFHECESCHKEEISQKIKQHYLNNIDITRENYKNIVQACSHRMFHIGAKSTTFLQSQATKSNVYFLLMGYAGPFIPMNITGFNIDLGIGHGSDAKFYYSTMFERPLNQEEETMKDVLLDMMVSFAKTGEPKLNTVEFRPIPKNGDLNYLHIKSPDNIRMETENIFGPINFWNSLGLGED